MTIDYIDAYRSRFGSTRSVRCSPSGISIALSIYYKAMQRGRVSDAELAEAYAANAVRTVFGWPTAQSMASARCCTR